MQWSVVLMRHALPAAVTGHEWPQRYTADDPRKVRPPYDTEGCRMIAPAIRRYFPEPGVSFGGTPMTFTPAPREASIACTTCPYFDFGSPFTKMIFSGRGS